MLEQKKIFLLFLFNKKYLKKISFGNKNKKTVPKLPKERKKRAFAERETAQGSGKRQHKQRTKENIIGVFVWRDDYVLCEFSFSSRNESCILTYPIENQNSQLGKNNSFFFYSLTRKSTIASNSHKSFPKNHDNFPLFIGILLLHKHTILTPVPTKIKSTKELNQNNNWRHQASSFLAPNKPRQD